MESHKEILEKVREFADQAHGEQMRKYSPDRYIVHPVRVMEICRQYNDSLPVCAAAVLHDVLEDTPVTEVDLFGFLSHTMNLDDAKKTMTLVRELTDVYVKKDYPQWNREKRKEMETERLSRVSAEAQLIKYADILDNSNEITAGDPGFAPRFLKECRALLECMDKGDTRLRDKALEKVSVELARLSRQKHLS